MLVLGRHRYESIMIGSEVVVKVIALCGTEVRLGVMAARETEVHRLEIYSKIHDIEPETAIARVKAAIAEGQSSAASDVRAPSSPGEAVARAAVVELMALAEITPPSPVVAREVNVPNVRRLAAVVRSRIGGLEAKVAELENYINNHG